MYKKYKVAIPGKDVIVVGDDNYDDLPWVKDDNVKVHLIKFNFTKDDIVTEHKVRNTIKVFDNTNRFIVDNNIRMYNSILKDIPGKKYYVQNKNNNLISFFRKNNKIVFSFPSLCNDSIDLFLTDEIFKDLLNNIEVVIMEQYQFDEMKWMMKNWNGNVIIHNENYPI